MGTVRGPLAFGFLLRLTLTLGPFPFCSYSRLLLFFGALRSRLGIPLRFGFSLDPISLSLFCALLSGLALTLDSGLSLGGFAGCLGFPLLSFPENPLLLRFSLAFCLFRFASGLLFCFGLSSGSRRFFPFPLRALGSFSPQTSQLSLFCVVGFALRDGFGNLRGRRPYRQGTARTELLPIVRGRKIPRDLL